MPSHMFSFLLLHSSYLSPHHPTYGFSTPQIFLDDVGVLVAMVAITLLAIVVVTIKVVIFQPTVTAHQPLVFILILRKKIHWLALNR